jgi:TorA maturation chaperone TorD
MGSSTTRLSTIPTPSNTRSDDAHVEARATVYRLLSKAFTYPLDQDWRLISQSFIPLMREAAAELGLEVASILDDLHRGWPQEPDARFLHEHTALFINAPGGILVPLNESVYFGPDRLVNTERTLAVKEAYLRVGFNLADGQVHLLPDHLTLELEFMALCLLGGIDCGEFFSVHVYSWQPQVAQKIIDRSDNTFYVSMARILAAFLISERQFFP